MCARWMVVCMVLVGCADDGIEADPTAADDTAAPPVTGDDDDVPAEGTVTYAEVAPILEANCTSCHADPPRNGAPFSLADYDAASAKAGRIVSRAVDGDPAPMPPGGLVLSDAEASTLVAWEEAGAPR